MSTKSLSIVVPLHNEADGLREFHKSLVAVLGKLSYQYELIYVNDGSTDDTDDILNELRSQNSNVKILRLSRNFGKESALSAGIAAAHGQAVIMLDGDGQHPVKLIPEFVKKWEDGAEVVVGIRTNDSSEKLTKRMGSSIFYKAFNRSTNQKLIPGSTDFRLIDQKVADAFSQLSETGRITRGLIDWLGFKREYIHFDPNQRAHGTATYNNRKLVGLATNSFVSMTPLPLYVFGYLGIFITLSSFVLGVAVFIEQLVLDDPLGWRFTGTAMLGTLILFLVGILLMAQGILSLYIVHISNQVKQRPLYIIDKKKSAGIDDTSDS